MKTINLTEKRGSAKDKALTPTEREKLYPTIKNDKYEIIFLLGAYAGLRVGEIVQCRFKWLEIIKTEDKEILAINIPNEDRDIFNKLKLWRPKTKRERSTYILESNFLYKVYEWFKNNPDGVQMTRQAIDNYIRRRWIPVLGRNFSAHALRSTAQNYMRYEKGIDPIVIQGFLGHADARTTLKHYNSMNKASSEAYLTNFLQKEQ